jgi:integrase/recombinase XerD
MSTLAPTLEAFFTERLIGQRQASPHTVTAYRDTFRLLLRFCQKRRGKAPSSLDIADLDARLVGEFLHHLGHERGNSTKTRNARLAAIHSLFRFAALRHPEHAALIQRVLAIPAQRFDRTIVSFLDPGEIDALLAAPNQTRWVGRRDHALLLLTIQTGLRVSELTQLRCQDIHLGTAAHVRCLGKGRKERCTPLTKQTSAVLRAWIGECNGQPTEPLFPTSRGNTLSRDAVGLLVTKYAKIAERNCPTLRDKTVTPHTLRHSAAMSLLHAGVDTSVIALWLGHEAVRTTQIYIHADLGLKERALARTSPAHTTPGRYRPPDSLIAFLEAL